MMEKYKETIDTYDKAAKDYQDKFMDMDLYNDTYDKFCELIDKESPDILEIGSGPGNITRYLLYKRPDFKILGIDLAPNMIDLARLNNPSASFELMDCRDIGKLDSRFDAIMCGFCMPYLSRGDCAIMTEDFARLLNHSGVVYISTMEDDYNKSGFEVTSFSGENRVYIYYHQANYLMDCLRNNGFDIIDLQRKDYPEPDGTYLTDLILIAKKN